MNEDEKKQKLLEKMNHGKWEELGGVISLTILGDSEFQTAEDLELLTCLPRLESLYLKELPETLTVEELVGALGKLQGVKNVNLEYFTVTQSVMKWIASLKNIERVVFMGTEFDDSALTPLSGQTHLKELRFFCSPVPEDFFENVGTLPQLETLELIPDGEEFRHLSGFAKEHFPNLKNLVWNSFFLSDEDIEVIISMNLESLKLASVILSTEYEDLQFLNRLKSLKKLDLFDIQEVTEVDWDLPNLTAFSISVGQDLQYVDFSGMPQLNKISLIRPNYNYDYIEEDEEEDLLYSGSVDFREKPVIKIMGLDSLKNLEFLHIRNIPTDCPIISELKNSTELKYIRISGSYRLKPEDLTYLNAMKKINNMDLEFDESVTASDLENLSERPELCRLTLNNIIHPGTVGAFVSKCPALISLGVLGKIGDEDIQALASKNLVYIFLDDCSNLSAESINTIFSLKKLQIVSLANALNETIEVRDFPDLMSLHLNNWKNLMEAEFVNLPNLDSLPLTCPALETLKIDNLPLKSLLLQNCPLVYYLTLRNVPNLTFMNVLGSPELDLTSLIRLPGLKKLEMTLDQLRQDFVLETLQELPKLEKLIIDCDQQKEGQEVNDTFIMEDAPEEEQSNCSLEERERIQKALPNCQIQFGYEAD